MRSAFRRILIFILALGLLLVPLCGLTEETDPFPDCGISSVTGSGDTVSVTWQSVSDSVVLHVKALGDADPNDGDDTSAAYTKVLGEQTLSLSDTAGENVTSSFTFTGLPEYYLIQTWFTDGSAASEPTDWNRNTKSIQDVIRYTPSDEVGDRYLPLAGLIQTAELSMPDDPQANRATQECVVADAGSYVLLKEGSVILNEAGGMSISKNGSRYTVTNADAKALALQSGQGICFIDYSGETTHYHFLRVSGISVSGTTVAFTGEPAASTDGDTGILEAIYLHDSVVYSGHFTSPPSISVSLDVDWSLTISYEIVFSLFGDKHFEINNEYEFRNGKVTVDSPDLNIDLPIRAIILPLADIVTLKAGLFFNISGNASGSVNFEMTGASGISVSGLKGHLTHDGPHFSFDPVTLEGDLFLGPRLGPELSIGGDILSVNIGWSVRCGFHLHAKLHGGEGGHVNTQSENWHACDAWKCICGEKSILLEGKAYASLGKLEVKIEPLNKSWPLGDFHCSWTFGNPEKSEAHCPWWGTRLRVTVLGSSDALSGAKVSYTPVQNHFESKASCDTDGNGLAIVWPYQGPVTVNAEWTNESDLTFKGSKTVTMVRDEPQDITIDLNTAPATLFFDANVASGTVTGMPEDMTFYPGLGSVKLPSEEPLLSGNTFLGWAEDGTQPYPDHRPGDTCTFEGSTTLYAVWKTMVPTDTWYLIYQPNGGMPVPQPQSASASSPIAITDIKPSKEGYEFAYWCETPDGTGNHYTYGNTVSPKYDDQQVLQPYVLLYAIYTPDVREVLYVENTAGSVTDMPVPNPDKSGRSDSPFTLSASVPKISGRRFSGWSRFQTATAPEYEPGETITLGVKDLTLYGVWSMIVDNYFVFYDANGGTGAPLTDTGIVGTPLTLSEKTPRRTHYTFLGWAADKNADMPDYLPGGTYDKSETITLYAVWQFDPVTAYRISFNANGGTGAPDTQFGAYGYPVTLSKKKPVRTAHVFSGWMIEGGMPGILLEPGSLVQFDCDVTLIAVWEPAYKIVSGAGSTWYRKKGGTLTFKANGDLVDFDRLEIDGGTVDTSDYTLTDGSTIVQLNEDYLRSLDKGRHTICFIYNDGQTNTAIFHIADTLPKTGDMNRPVLWTFLAALSAAGVSLVIRRREV